MEFPSVITSGTEARAMIFFVPFSSYSTYSPIHYTWLFPVLLCLAENKVCIEAANKKTDT